MAMQRHRWRQCRTVPSDEISMNLVLLCVVIGLAAYLLLAIVRPEKF